MNSATVSDLIGNQIDPTTLLIELRERLQRTEIELEHAVSRAERELVILQESKLHLAKASSDNYLSLQTRLTSQYQRIAKLEDDKSDLQDRVGKLEAVVTEFTSIRDRMVKQEMYRAVLIEILKIGGPTIIVLMLAVEKAAPGLLDKLAF